MVLSNVDIILASASPRRKELLTQLGLQFDTYPVTIDESQQRAELAEHYVLRVAYEKAEKAYSILGSTAPIVAADTIVTIDNMIIGKPKDPTDARKILGMLSGKMHQVLTGLVIKSSERNLSSVCRTNVFFRSIKESEVTAYIATGETFDKAGAYAIQGRGAAFVKRIEGSYSNVMGLPLYELSELLTKFDIYVLKKPLRNV